MGGAGARRSRVPPPASGRASVSLRTHLRASGGRRRGRPGGQALEPLQRQLGREPRLGVGVPAILQQLRQSPPGLRDPPHPGLSGEPRGENSLTTTPTGLNGEPPGWLRPAPTRTPGRDPPSEQGTPKQGTPPSPSRDPAGQDTLNRAIPTPAPGRGTPGHPGRDPPPPRAGAPLDTHARTHPLRAMSTLSATLKHPLGTSGMGPPSLGHGHLDDTPSPLP